MDSEPPAHEETDPSADGWSDPTEEDWGGAPLTKFRCPVHSVPEEWQIVSVEGQRMIRYACPVDGCGHEWTVKRIRP